eukprot:m.199463 g.199463  ORF g.199463 m.199463 type:complete len:1299 (+) comp17682_c4_seq1:563-4459(+)
MQASRSGEQHPLDRPQSWWRWALQQITYEWMSPILRDGARHPLTESEIWPTPRSVHLRASVQQVQQDMAGGTSLARAMFRAVQRLWWMAALFRGLSEVFNVLALLAFQRLLKFCQGRLLDEQQQQQEQQMQQQAPMWAGEAAAPWLLAAQQWWSSGGLLCAALFLFSLLQNITLNQFIERVFDAGAQVRFILIQLVYEKGLRIRPSEKQQFNAGFMIQSSTKNAEKLERCVLFATNVWSAPLNLCWSVLLLWINIGPPALVGIACACLLIPFEMRLGRFTGALFKGASARTDARLEAVGQVMRGIGTVKYNAWESIFHAKISSLREAEVKEIRRSVFVQAANFFLISAGPIVMSIATFTYLFMTSATVSVDQVFVALAILSNMKHPFKVFPKSVTLVVECRAMLRQVQAFLQAKEALSARLQPVQSDTPRIVATAASFAWSKTDPGLALENVNITLHRQDRIMVVGQVGSGKSLLLSGLVGEAELLRGVMQVDGVLGYLPQGSWVLNATLKENILVGQPYDEKRFADVLFACALHEDVKRFPEGIDSEIGERGVTLSGGQRRRVALARVLYSRAQVFVLDDPLSSLDASTAKHVFDHAIMGLLRGPCIMSCNQPQFLAQASHIMCMENGYARLFYPQDFEKDAYGRSLLHQLQQQQEREAQTQQAVAAGRTQSSVSASASANTNVAQSGGSAPSSSSSNNQGTGDVAKSALKALSKSEARLVGSVPLSVYWAYAEACGRIFCVLSILSIVLSNLLNMLKDYQLGQVSGDDASVAAAQFKRYMAMAVGSLAATLGSTLLFAVAGLRGASALHNRLLDRIMRAPLSFFHSTPSGQILVRFSSDVGTLDTSLPGALGSWFNAACAMLTTFFAIIFITPLLALPLGLLAWFYLIIQTYYQKSSVSLKRLDGISKAPSVSLLVQSLEGAATLRTAGLQPEFLDRNQRLVKANANIYYAFNSLNRWLAFRLDLLGSLVVFLAAVVAVRNRETLSISVLGMVLTLALRITQTLSFVVRNTVTLENQFNSVERIWQFVHVPVESESGQVQIDPEWPRQASVTFQNVSLVYPGSAQPALDSVTLYVTSGERVGIVGRTGSGKSTLVAALFRMQEISAGKILLQDVPTATLKLRYLRGVLCHVAQEPAIFNSSIRFNVDPTGRCADAHVRAAVEAVGLDSLLRHSESGLDTQVKQDSMSFGEMQLLSLARCLLRKPKVLVLDEATAHVDAHTDRLIQTMLDSQFKGVTTFIVAHRLEDIMSCDRVIVMDSGRIVEVGNPTSLLANSRTALAALARDLSFQNKPRDARA